MGHERGSWAEKERKRLAERLSPYFDLQLRFAEKVAAVKSIELGTAVFLYTNLYQRFGFGYPIDTTGRITPPRAEWSRYIAGLAQCDTHKERVRYTVQYFRTAPPEPDGAFDRSFGCFSYDFDPKVGEIKIHFKNIDQSGLGPLSSARRGVRREELQKMFTHIKARHPEARSVHGLSWLYAREEYRRLFPDAFSKSLVVHDEDNRYWGTSRWGQFFTSEGGIHNEIRKQFLQKLERLTPTHPHLAFPMQTFVASAPIKEFYTEYGIGA